MQADCTAAAHAAACGATHARGPVHGERVPVQKASAGEGGVACCGLAGEGVLEDSTGGGHQRQHGRRSTAASGAGGSTRGSTGGGHRSLHDSTGGWAPEARAAEDSTGSRCS